jgi:hypothetical protein
VIGKGLNDLSSKQKKKERDKDAKKDRRKEYESKKQIENETLKGTKKLRYS